MTTCDVQTRKAKMALGDCIGHRRSGHRDKINCLMQIPFGGLQVVPLQVYLTHADVIGRAVHRSRVADAIQHDCGGTFVGGVRSPYCRGSTTIRYRWSPPGDCVHWYSGVTRVSVRCLFVR